MIVNFARLAGRVNYHRQIGVIWTTSLLLDTEKSGQWSLVWRR